MNNSKTILTLVFLIAGTLLTTAVTVLPAAYAAGDDDDGNKNKAEDDSAATIADCDDNDVERAVHFGHLISLFSPMTWYVEYLYWSDDHKPL